MVATTTITINFDPLNRLTGAAYSSGEVYTYGYDKAGNRTSMVAPSGATTYLYNQANQLTHSNGITHTWDANGNLLDDGVYTYEYDYTNRLTAVSDQGSAFSFAYNGLGDRYQQVVAGETITYTLDLAAALPQVLSDGTNTYLYGVGRIAQQSAYGTHYYLPDALGSARQLVDASGFVALTQSFDPFGNPLARAGGGNSPYGFAGEWTDSTGLQYLRARYYSPSQGRFLIRDPFPGLLGLPASQHPYAYALNNPVLHTDPSGEVVPVIVGVLIAASLGGALGGLGYYGLSGLLGDPCFEWNWGQAALWGGVGLGLGAALGAIGIGGWWVGVQFGLWVTTAASVACADGDCTNEIRFATQIGHRALRGGGSIPSSHIRFTQNSISPFTRAGVYLDDLAQEIANGYFRGYIRIVEYQGKLYTLDNRRLAAFRLLNENVPAKLVDINNPAILAEFMRKFSTMDDGLSIIIRGTGLKIW